MIMINDWADLPVLFRYYAVYDPKDYDQVKGLMVDMLWKLSSCLIRKERI